MPITKRKKIEIVVEAFKKDDVIAWLLEQGVKGYTTIDGIGGFGHHGKRGAGDVARVFDNVMIVAIAREEIARKVLEESVNELKDYAAIVAISDVEIMRPEHF